MAPRRSVIPHLAASIQAKRLCRPARDCVPTAPGTASLLRNTPSTWVKSLQSRHGSSAAPSLPSQRVGGARPRPAQIYDDGEAEQIRPKRKPGPMIWASCLFGLALGTWLTYVYVSFEKAAKKSSEMALAQNADVSDRWRDRTRNFDQEVEASESFMLLRAKRKRLINEAYGNVLEVSCGTGRNMDLYDLRPYDPKETERFGRSRQRIIKSLTFNDQSEVMVEQAIQKFQKLEMFSKQEARFQGDVNFIVGDAGVEGVIQRPPGGYDTIIQTMGVCSMVDAPGFLRKLGKLCRQPGEKADSILSGDDDDRGGKILLLEHGRSYYDWMNHKILDRIAKTHADRYGCWWNKDIDQVVEDSGLIVERIKRYNFGTTWEIVLRPRP